MSEKKHFVYSARTTEKGLALLNKTKGDRSWDAFINEAVAAHYNLPLESISLPPSKFLADREANRKAKAEAKAAKEAEKKAKAAEKAKKAKEAGKPKKQAPKPAETAQEQATVAQVNGEVDANEETPES